MDLILQEGSFRLIVKKKLSGEQENTEYWRDQLFFSECVQKDIKLPVKNVLIWVSVWRRMDLVA